MRKKTNKPMLVKMLIVLIFLIAAAGLCSLSASAAWSGSPKVVRNGKGWQKSGSYQVKVR